VRGGKFSGKKQVRVASNHGSTQGYNSKIRVWKAVISEDDVSTSENEENTMDDGEDPGGDDAGVVENLLNYTSTITNNQSNQQNTKTPSAAKKDNAQQIRLGIQYIINSTILFTREHLKAGGRIDNVSKLICDSAIAKVAHLAPTILTKSALPENRFTEEDLNKFAKKVKSFGASGKRTQEQTAAALAHAEFLVNSLPTNSIQIWSDGSKMGKGARGPTGAGAIIKETGSEIPIHRLTYHLGDSTNQAAEIWAIGGALETLRGDYNAEAKDIYVFSDSDFAIKCITGFYTSKVHHNIVKQVIALVASFPKNSVHFQHIAGHAGIPGNEAADALAKEGAVYSERSPILHDLPYIAKTFGFNHQLIISDCCCTCSSNQNCNLCNGSMSDFTDNPTSNSRNVQRTRSNSISSTYSNNSDDLSEELILPNVFREEHTTCGSSLIFNKYFSC
jgi:ribonuclease HI